MKHLIPILTLLALSAPALAQSRSTNCDAATPNNALCLEWTATTTTNEGLPLALPVTYRVERKLGTSGAWTTAATGLTITKHYAQGLAPGDYTFRVYANCAGCVESPPSPTATKAATAVPVTPSAPPVLIIAVLIRADGPPVYRRVAKVTPRAGEFIIVAPLSASALYAIN